MAQENPYGTSKEYLSASAADLLSIAQDAVDRSEDMSRNLGGDAGIKALVAAEAARSLQEAARSLAGYLEENGMAELG